MTFVQRTELYYYWTTDCQSKSEDKDSGTDVSSGVANLQAHRPRPTNFSGDLLHTFE